MRNLVILIGLGVAGYYGWSWWQGRGALDSSRARAEKDEWSRRQLRSVELFTPPGWERRILAGGAPDSATYVDTRSPRLALPPGVIVSLLTDPRARTLEDGVTEVLARRAPGVTNEKTVRRAAGRLPCGLNFASAERTYEGKGSAIHERYWLIDCGENRRVAILGASLEADWPAFEPTLKRMVETFGPAGPTPAGGVPARTLSDEQILAAVRQLNGTEAEAKAALRTVGAERGVVWARMCQLWAEAKAKGDRDAEYYPEALQIVALVDEVRPSMAEFAADPLKTAPLKPAILEAVLSILVTRPTDDELAPVLDGLHLVAPGAEPGIVGSLIAVRAKAPDDRAKTVAAYAIQAWLAGKHKLLRDATRKNGNVVDVTHPTLAAAVAEIVGGGEVALAQMRDALPRVEESIRNGSPDDRGNAEAERAVIAHVRAKLTR